MIGSLSVAGLAWREVLLRWEWLPSTKHFQGGIRGCLCSLMLTTLSFLLPLRAQLGFGSFLGIVGVNLVENRRQMVREHTSSTVEGRMLAP